jgi:hypothetical protein
VLLACLQCFDIAPFFRAAGRLLILAAVAVPALACAATQFEESEGFISGSSTLSGWSGTFLVTDGDAHSGTQSLDVSTEATTEGAESAPILFLDFWVKSAADASENPDALIDFGGASLAFLKEGDSGTFHAFDARGDGSSVPVETDIPLDTSGVSAVWTHITIRRDVGAGTWDLYVNGKPVACGLGLETPASGDPKAHFTAGESGVFVDDFVITATNPLFMDRDNDGIPDAYEVANGMNPRMDDRLGDADLDDVTNIQEFLQSKGVAFTPPGGSGILGVVYVDKTLGNDSNTGSYSYPVEGDGPKATIAEAMKVGHEGGKVAVIEGEYDEGEIVFSGKPFDLVTVGQVKF